MFGFSNNSSSSSTLQAELSNRQEVNNELLDKIIALQAERQLARERELALLELLSFYRKDLLEKASISTGGVVVIPEIVRTSPTTVKSSDAYGSLPSDGSSSRHWSPVQSESAAEEGYLFEGFEALRALLALSATPTVLSLFQTTSQAEAYQVSATNLGQISDLVSRFVTDAATLRGCCVRSQDELVPEVLESFMADATSTLDQFMDPSQADPEHPMELSFIFHGLLGTMKMLCQQSWCLGPQSNGCLHTLSPKMDGRLAVTLVHPGGAWKDLQRCLFFGLKGATMLEGDIFTLVGMAHIREPQSHEFLDDAGWAAVFRDTNVLDIFWKAPGDSDFIQDHQPEETDQFVHGLAHSEDDASGASLASEAGGDTSSVYEALEQAEEVLARLDFIDDGGVPALEQAEAALAELDLYSQRRGGYQYLRAGEGTNASLRSASFITASEGLGCDSPEPPKCPYPFLKRGDGLRRRGRSSAGNKA
ncbi:hypothetical protein Q9L58_002628 [Maublancomyces gigas]|uniref:Uncharacterized protein n=1 Tax=Discina gigas TaxID=1032678 RepID=A0ABR3GQZ5_9PEZI